MSLGLRGRSIALSGAVLTLTTLIVASLLITQSYYQSVNDFTNHARVYTQAISHAIEPAVLVGGQKEIETMLGMARQDQTVSCATVFNIDGRVLSRSANDLADCQPLPLNISQALNRPDTVLVQSNTKRMTVLTAMWQSRAPMDFELALDDSKGAQNEGLVAVLAVTFELESLYGDIQSRILMTVAAMIGILIVTLGITSVAVHQLLRPLKMLTHAAQRIASGDRSTRAHAQAPCEVGMLARAFNEMADQVQLSYEQVERKVERRTAELVRANRAKNDFLANMSHEIRTPMTAILGYSEQLMDEGLSTVERRDACNTLRRNGEHLLQIINDILDLSKIEAGRLTIERIPCRLDELLGDVVQLMADRARQKRLQLDVERGEDLPEFITTDPTRLKQILLNLLTNAIKFTHQGRITLGIRRCGVASGASQRATDRSGKRLEFEVTDTGIGMSPDQMAKIFKPFTQADETMARRFGGTGLGLTISQHLVTALGGKISVQSEPGVGSRFVFSIESSPESGVHLSTTNPPVAAERSNGDSQCLRNLRILVAEDGPDNQRLIAAFLVKAGAAPTLANNGAAAVEAALSAQDRGCPFDVILMDMQMPILDGYAATQELRRRGYARPIIALTAHALTSDEKRCLEAGCDAYATKPINRRKLLQLIAESAGVHVVQGAVALQSQPPA